MKNKKNLIIVSMMVVVAVMAIGYSYFATRLNINATGNITSEWNVYFSNIRVGTITGSASNAATPSVSGTTANMEASLELPGDSITYELTLTNAGTIGAVIEDIEAKAEGSSAIIYSISGLKIGDKLASGASKVITVKIEYDAGVTSQPSETSKTLTVTIDVAQDIGQSIESVTPSIDQPLLLSSAILKNNTAYADNISSPNVTGSTGINFGQPSSSTNGNGLYYTENTTENDQRVYYFRGNVENNYVSFGTYKKEYSYKNLQTGETISVRVAEPIMWRIVRINEDGSIRLVKQDSIGVSTYNNASYDNAYVGYMYGTPDSSNYELTHANKINSTIKTNLDTWYNTHLSTYSNLFSSDSGFCNDRSIATSAHTWESSDTALGYGTNETYFGGYSRFMSNWAPKGEKTQPQFKCTNENNDLFTLTTSNKGNKKLIKPIGMLTIDEVVYAGGVTFMPNNDYYLVNNDYWWIGSPIGFEGSYAGTWHAGDSGMIAITNVSGQFGIRPVINLKSTVEISGGKGTSFNPYIIQID